MRLSKIGACFFYHKIEHIVLDYLQAKDLDTKQNDKKLKTSDAKTASISATVMEPTAITINNIIVIELFSLNKI